MDKILSTERNQSGTKHLYEFTQGIEVDARLARQEVRVQLAWVDALEGIGILTPQERAEAHHHLEAALAEIQSGKFEWRVQDEDIHMNLERTITERAGALGKKMHLGRSRNDLIATTLRLYVADTLGEADQALATLIAALAKRAEQDAQVIVPGLTHLQHGQPVSHGHVLLAHAWPLMRDRKRLATARENCLSSMPLGSAALSGTPLPLNLKDLAQKLGFSGPSQNSYDSVGDRDFIIEALDAFASIGIHLSRLAEDCIYWASTPVRLVRLPTRWSTGSSIMPNKRNPDVPELIRAKSAHLIAAAANAHTLLKGLPTSYDSDLHELKTVFMRAQDELLSCLSIAPAFMSELEPDGKRARELLNLGHVLATEIADELTHCGVPFRESYGAVAALVERAEQLGVQVHELSLGEFQQYAPQLKPGFIKNLTAQSAVARRTASGGTSSDQVRQAAQKLQQQL